MAKSRWFGTLVPAILLPLGTRSLAALSREYVASDRPLGT